MIKASAIIIVAAVSIFRLAGYFNEPRLTDTEIHAIAGGPADVASTSVGGGRPLPVVSWNIERGVQFQKIVTTLRALEPDVILLQEVDRYCRRSGNRDVARDLAQMLGMNWVSAGEYQEIGEAGGTPAAVTGQAILSREPIADAATIVFAERASFRWRLNPMQPRRGGRIALEATTAGVRFFNLHLESGGDDELRTRQLAEVIAASKQHGDCVVIAGDFNNDGTFQSFMFEGLGRAGFVDALGTTPRQTSINHRHPPDRFLVGGGKSPGGRGERVDNTSDHYPLVARISR